MLTANNAWPLESKGWATCQQMKTLGYFVSHDRSMEASYIHTKRKVWKAWWGDLSNGKFTTSLNKKVKLLNRKAAPIIIFQSMLWPWSKSYPPGNLMATLFFDCLFDLFFSWELNWCDMFIPWGLFMFIIPLNCPWFIAWYWANELPVKLDWYIYIGCIYPPPMLIMEPLLLSGAAPVSDIPLMKLPLFCIMAMFCMLLIWRPIAMFMP